MAHGNSWMTCPEPPLDPPEENECPECDSAVIVIRAGYAKCTACDWVAPEADSDDSGPYPWHPEG